jgi:hypothetical protein
VTNPKDAATDSVRDFVVETLVKPDGRRIHYYEWPDRPPELANAQRSKNAGKDRRRV